MVVSKGGHFLDLIILLDPNYLNFMDLDKPLFRYVITHKDFCSRSPLNCKMII